MSHVCSVKFLNQNLLAIEGKATCWKKLKRKFQSCILVSSRNPRCSSYFRSEISIIDEKKRQLNSKNKYIIHPLSKFRAWYELWICFIYLFVLLTKPLEAAFSRRSSIVHDLTRGLLITAGLDLFCLVDVYMNFNTGYVMNKYRKVEMRPSKIAKNYIKSPFFVCDVLSSIPRNLPYLLWKPLPPKAVLGVINIFGLLKIVRLYTLIKTIYRVSQYYLGKVSGIVFLFCAILVTVVLIHWIACFQFIIPRLTGRYFSEDLILESWIYTDNLYEKSLGEKYIHCLFKGSANILSMRLKFYKISLPEEYIMACLTYIIGKILICCIWIILAIAILNSRTMEIKFEEIINQLDEYMKQKQLPFNLRDRISQYYNFKYQKKYFKEELVTGLLSDGLREDVNMHVCKSLIASVSLFKELTPYQISQVVAKLIPEIFLPHDTIIQSGTHGDAMYFLSSGTVAVYTHSGKEVCHLQDGAYFGEISLVLKDQMRTATIIAIEISQVYKLTKRDFEKQLIKNKAVFKKIVANADRRLKRILQAEEIYKRKLFEQTYQGKDTENIKQEKK